MDTSTDEYISSVSRQSDDDVVAVSFAPVANIGDSLPENPPSERLEKLRSYYAELGRVREMMEKELTAQLAGETIDGEIESKLYEFSHSWKAIAGEISRYDETHSHQRRSATGEYHVGQNLVGTDFSGQELTNADFSGANLQDANFKDAHLSGVDFTGADLSGADLSGADLSDSIFAGAKLKGTNFTGANMEGVILRDADIEDAILIDIRMDELAIEELQALVEYLAVYYPHKLNLQRINLSLLDLKRIDLRQVNLKGVDFTGMDFTGVNIMELDLSECIITPEQIAQALGRIPSADELKKILAPKKKKKAKHFYIDFSEFLSNGHFTGWVDLTKNSISTDQLVKAFLKVKGALFKKPEEKDEIIFEKAKEFHAGRLEEERKAYNDEQKKNIEDRKQKLLDEQQAGQERASKSEKYVPISVNLGRDSRE
ncbi:MAG: pentapeptide repeat-containing protein [Acetobacter sp.]|nr:pentapeptide repeat-containing protein [Acetobacter sp.]